MKKHSDRESREVCFNIIAMRSKRVITIKDMYIQGSMTIEAAMILPVFLIGMLSLISVMEMLDFHIRMQQALYTEAERLSIECIDGHNVALSSIEEDIRDILEKDGRSYRYVENGWDGIDFSKSRLNSEEYLVIRAEYVMTPFATDMFALIGVPISQQSAVHVWCGYINGYFGEDDDSEYVYITNDSQVYHRNRECSHIRLSVRSVSGDEIQSLRNDDGGKYYSCEICHSSLSDKTLYITNDGNRYHSKLGCSGLKRTVRAVKLTNAGDRRPCSRCGK